MRCPLCTAFLAASWSIVLPGAFAGSLGVAERARTLLGRNDAVGAADLLEEALPSAGSERPELLGLLRRAYETSARQAEEAGNVRLAETYRDNLLILNRKAPGKPPESPPGAAASPRDPAVSRASTRLEKIPLADGAGRNDLGAPPEPQPLGPPREPESPAAVPPRADDPAAPGPAPERAEATVAGADAAFVAKRYDEAGKIYATLDREHRLPPSRKDHWAYCRWVAVVQRINAHPSAEEWANIDAEILRIRELSPRNWFGEYLRSRAAERPQSKRMTKPSQLVVRGSSPEEGPAPDAGDLRPTRPAKRSDTPAKHADPAPSATTPRSQPPASRGPARKPAPSGAWQIRETPSFRIMHDDPELAERVAELAEATRAEQTKRWTDGPPRGPWAPRCDIYLYPNAKVFSQMTGQPEESPGFSTMGMNAGRIVARRVNLRADHPNLVHAILPHEVTHVVLADLFPHQQIPRWADEGMAVLSEPGSEQGLRAADLERPLASGQLFKVEDLLVMDYPDGRYWGLYYAQSVSVTRFLVEQASPAKFIEFVQKSQRNGTESELRRIYGIEGFAGLQRRWLEYARNQASVASDKKTATASAGDIKTAR